MPRVTLLRVVADAPRVPGPGGVPEQQAVFEAVDDAGQRWYVFMADPDPVERFLAAHPPPDRFRVDVERDALMPEAEFLALVPHMRRPNEALADRTIAAVRRLISGARCIRCDIADPLRLIPVQLMRSTVEDGRQRSRSIPVRVCSTCCRELAAMVRRPPWPAT